MAPEKKRQGEGAQIPGAGEREPGPRVGWLAGWRGGEDGAPLVDFAGNDRGTLPARSTVPLDRASADVAAEQRQGVVLLFEEGDPARPLIMGLLQEASATPLLDLVLQADGEEEAQETPAREVQVDGRRVVLQGDDEVVLRCGKASITLRRNGKIVIRGAYLVSRAEGTNRIRGGSVQIN